MPPEMTKSSICCKPLPALEIIAESEFQTLAVETDNPIFNLLHTSETAKPVPDIVTETEPERGQFVVPMEDIRATLYETLKFPTEDDARTEVVIELLCMSPPGNLDNIDESDIHLDSRKAVDPIRALGELEETTELREPIILTRELPEDGPFNWTADMTNKVSNENE